MLLMLHATTGWRLQVELSTKHGLGTATFDDLFGAQRELPITWGDYMRPGLERCGC